MFHKLVYGFKLHIIINNKREIPNFMLTKENIDNRSTLKTQLFS